MSRKKKGNHYPHPMWGPANGGAAPTRQLVLKSGYTEKWRTFFIRLALGRFKWHNLPDSVDARYLEWVLLMQSRGIFFQGLHNETLEPQLLATGVIPQGPPDIYGNFDKYQAQGANGKILPVPDGEGVVIYDSMGRYSIWNAIELSIQELVEVDMQQMSNLRQQREMGIVEVPEDSKQDATRMINALGMDEEYAVVARDFKDNVRSSIFSTGAEYKQDKFHEDRTAKLNAIYLQLGIDHVPFEKSAHMLQSETDKSTDAVMRVRDDLLNARRQAVDAVNKKWGTDISVEWNAGERGEDDSETDTEEEADV